LFSLQAHRDSSAANLVTALRHMLANGDKRSLRQGQAELCLDITTAVRELLAPRQRRQQPLLPQQQSPLQQQTQQPPPPQQMQPLPPLPPLQQQQQAVAELDAAERAGASVAQQLLHQQQRERQQQHHSAAAAAVSDALLTASGDPTGAAAAARPPPPPPAQQQQQQQDSGQQSAPQAALQHSPTLQQPMQQAAQQPARQQSQGKAESYASTCPPCLGKLVERYCMPLLDCWNVCMWLCQPSKPARMLFMMLRAHAISIMTLYFSQPLAVCHILPITVDLDMNVCFSQVHVNTTLSRALTRGTGRGGKDGKRLCRKCTDPDGNHH